MNWTTDQPVSNINPDLYSDVWDNLHKFVEYVDPAEVLYDRESIDSDSATAQGDHPMQLSFYGASYAPANASHQSYSALQEAQNLDVSELGCLTNWEFQL